MGQARIARLVSGQQLLPRKLPLASANALSGRVLWPRGVLLRTDTDRVVYGSLVGHIRISAPNVDLFRVYKSMPRDRPSTAKFRRKLKDLVHTKTWGCTNLGPSCRSATQSSTVRTFSRALGGRYTLIWFWRETPSLCCGVVAQLCDWCVCLNSFASLYERIRLSNASSLPIS